MIPAEERRRHYRAQIPGIRASLGAPGDVEVLDVSVSGLRLETQAQLAAGERCFLELRHRGQTVNLEGQVRWSNVCRVTREQEALRPVFRIGLAFLDLVIDGEGGVGDWLLADPWDEVH